MATGQTHFYSRSRRSHWHKGATSGHVQHVESIAIDCDGDVLLIKARQVGGAVTKDIVRVSSAALDDTEILRSRRRPSSMLPRFTGSIKG